MKLTLHKLFTPTALKLIDFLMQAEPGTTISLRALAERIGCSRASVSANVSKLASAGILYVEEVPINGNWAKVVDLDLENVRGKALCDALASYLPPSN